MILHASLGTGHQRAAEALGDAFRRWPGVEVEVIDALDHASRLLRTAVSETYVRMSEQAPLLYRLLYDSSDSNDAAESISGNRRLGQVERFFLGRLETKLAEARPDVFICTHALPAHILQHLTREGRQARPFYLTVTDFMAHGGWLTDGAAGYFLPSTLTREILIARGVPARLLHVTGIPVPLELAEPKPATEARARHDLPADGPLLLLFGGGIDPLHVRTRVTGLLAGPTAGMLVVVAGRNAALTEVLADLTDGPAMRLRVLGLIDYVDDLVAAGDLIITKAGGLIVSEVLARGRPMVIIDPLPGQEEWNADFVVAAGAAVQFRLPEMVPPGVFELLDQPARLEGMALQARGLGRPRAALDIAEHILAQLPATAGAVAAEAPAPGNERAIAR
jgi:processive 1,2-diacylglycerol beta-glucosyltransferase